MRNPAALKKNDIVYISTYKSISKIHNEKKITVQNISNVLPLSSFFIKRGREYIFTRLCTHTEE